MYILGISAFYHDSAACLVKDGRVIAAAQEERFTRVKHDSSFPRKAINFCLSKAGISIAQVNHVAFYEKSSLKFDRLIKTYLMSAPRGLKTFQKSMPLWLGEKLWMNRVIKKELGFRGAVICAEHHQSHAASAFYPSPFESSAVLVMDGVGEWASTSCAVGNGSELNIYREMHFPHSLGLLYSAFTYYAGFKVNSGEYKLMGLAPYGEPLYRKKILDNLIDLKDDGSFRLNMEYFDFETGSKMTSLKFNQLFGRDPRVPESEISRFDMDIAASIQEVAEEVVLRIAQDIHSLTGHKNLCLAGGVALNCVANGRLLREGPFDKIWIQPAAGDAGGAMGAALYAHNMIFKNERVLEADGKDSLSGSYLGTEYSSESIESSLNKIGANFIKMEKSEKSKIVAQLLAKENVVGWFTGAMEFGPRALGARSILGDPRSPEMQSIMNLKIKYRESFRPFAPAVLAAKAKEWFSLDGHENRDGFNSPYMLIVGDVMHQSKALHPASEGGSVDGFERLRNIESKIPAVTHVDYSARIQTVHKDTNPEFHDLLTQFDLLTGCPVLINTSFNVRGEPIVENPTDAYRCFMRTGMDFLVIGDYLMDKNMQPDYQDEVDWKKEFKLD